MRFHRAFPMVLSLLLAGCTGALSGNGERGGGNGDDDNDPSSDRTLYFYYGPMKIMHGETILYSIEAVTGHTFGRWDFTAPDPASQAFFQAGNGDGAMYRHCRLFGGCMEHRIPLGRTSFLGTAYVLELDRAVTEACYDTTAFGMFPGDQAPGPTVQAIDVIRHQFRKAFGDEPSDIDIQNSLAYFESHLSSPEFPGMSAIESAGRGHCRAILATNRFLFY